MCLKRKKIKCLLCEKSFSLLRHHIRTHTAERTFQCSPYRKSFKESNQPKRHIHTGGFLQRRKFFISSCELKKHCWSHSGERPLIAYYVQTHTGERPFICLKCPKAFKQTDQLKVHYRTHRQECVWKSQTLQPEEGRHNFPIKTSFTYWWYKKDFKRKKV